MCRFALGLLGLGLVPLAALVVYYAVALGYGPLELVWSAVLLLAGHAVGLVAVLEWSVFLGLRAGRRRACSCSASRQPRPEQAPVTVRGPVSYAGPGSLGGTESALRR